MALITIRDKNYHYDIYDNSCHPDGEICHHLINTDHILRVIHQKVPIEYPKTLRPMLDILVVYFTDGRTMNFYADDVTFFRKATGQEEPDIPWNIG